MDEYLLTTRSYPFAAAAVLSILLAGYVLVSGAGRILTTHLLALALGGLIWSVFNMLTSFDPAGLTAPGYLAELLLLLGWYGLLERLLRGPYLQSMPELVRRGIRWAWLIVALAGVAALLPIIGVKGIVPAADLYHLGILLLSSLALALSAQLYGDATIESHSALRSICMAAVLVTGFQGLQAAVLLLAESVPSWMMPVRAAGLSLATVLVAHAMHGNPQWSLAIFVSPQARVYAPRLVAVGIFLLVLLAFAPVFRAMPTVTAQMSAMGLILVASVPLLFVLFSDRLRAQLRVFISKHFLPFRYDYREEWLRLIDTLASPEQELPLPERAIKSLAQIVSSPAGVLWMRQVDDGPFVCTAAWNAKLQAEVVVHADDPVIRLCLIATGFWTRPN